MPDVQEYTNSSAIPDSGFFRRHPYKGILTEVAKARGVNSKTIQQQIKSRHPEVLRMVLAKIEEREALVREFTDKVSGRLAA